MKIEWSRQSRSDLRANHDYIARDSEYYARLQVKRLVERVEYVASRPMAGHPVHEFPKLELRETHQEGYRIIYALDEGLLQVVTIIHIRQVLKKRRLRRHS
jgi:plasmid stabilization system protein ParE